MSDEQRAEGGAGSDPLAGLPPPPVDPPVPSSSIPSVPPPPDAPLATTAPDRPAASPNSPYVPLPARTRRRGVVIGVAAACAALVGAGAFAVVTVAGGSSKSGASSPEGAVRDLVAAANDQDALGALDALLPSERRTWGDPLVRMIDEAKRLELAAPDADLSSVRGVDLQFDVQTGKTEPVASDITVVPVTGSATSTVDLSALPIGPLLVDQGVKPTPGATPQPTTSRVDGRLATVQRDGRWYVSLAYTAAENARRAAGDLQWPAPGQGIVAAGAPSPVAAMTQLVQAVGQLSVAHVLAGLDPQEAEVAQRAGPWFVDDLQRRLDAVVHDHALTMTFLDPRFSVIRQEGDRATVRVDHLGVEVESDGTRYRYDGGCLATTAPEAQEETHCMAGGAPSADTIDPQLRDTPFSDVSAALSKFADDLRSALKDLAEQGVVVTQVDGEWYVSPVASGTTALLGVMNAFDRSELDTLIGDGREVLDRFNAAFAASLGVGGDGFGDDSEDTGASGPSAIPLDQYFACQGKSAYEAVVACVQEGLASGKFTRELVDGIYLVPECAWKGLRYDAGLQQLSDAEYTDRVTLSASCFEQKVAAGVITENQIPFELLHVECLKGKNPSHMTTGERAAYSTCQQDGVSSDEDATDASGATGARDPAGSVDLHGD